MDSLRAFSECAVTPCTSLQVSLWLGGQSSPSSSSPGLGSLVRGAEAFTSLSSPLGCLGLAKRWRRTLLAGLLACPPHRERMRQPAPAALQHNVTGGRETHLGTFQQSGMSTQGLGCLRRKRNLPKASGIRRPLERRQSTSNIPSSLELIVFAASALKSYLSSGS